MTFDEKIMKRAIELAQRGRGRVSPNPLVGAVIVKDGKIIAEGWHKAFGENHAEIDAINNAKGADLTGATIYVNLEPCVHHGKTPPCAQALINKKFGRVVIGMSDPNPLVAGKGIEQLKSAGMEVTAGILEEECKWLNRFFVKHITTGMPYIILKIAQSMNGAIAAKSGQSQWITGEMSRKLVHTLRSQVDAVLVGSGTAKADNPELTVRAVKGRNPKRVILDTNLSLPIDLKLFTGEFAARTIICCDKNRANSEKAETLKKSGVKIIETRTDSSGKIDINYTIKILSDDYSISSIMVEGGSSVYSSFLKAGAVDEIQAFIAPMVIGNGLNSFSEIITENLDNAQRFKIKSVSKCGKDIHAIFVDDINCH